ncbi:late competence development ComFB family protein [Natranaerobius trueperi]|uniref:Competence protein ComFB n=1 Tax=Natranaerobius trueperi TaxID=759412 RepID=A0A226BYF4_9FIRM|nr:late competence development ComFB family protein [Natranaerobius trueperi]OWZ84043.1 competence protein ComFB [Natranaerobius trueperi]
MSNLNLKNYMEDVVLKKLNSLLAERSSICNCDHCKKDIMAIALNNLPPRYIVTEKGEIYSKIDSLMVQFSTDVTAEIVKAIEKVNKSPRH